MVKDLNEFLCPKCNLLCDVSPNQQTFSCCFKEKDWEIDSGTFRQGSMIFEVLLWMIHNFSVESQVRTATLNYARKKSYTGDYTRFLCSSPIYFFLDQHKYAFVNTIGCSVCLLQGFKSEDEWISHWNEFHRISNLLDPQLI